MIHALLRIQNKNLAAQLNTYGTQKRTYLSETLLYDLDLQRGNMKSDNLLSPRKPDDIF